MNREQKLDAAFERGKSDFLRGASKTECPDYPDEELWLNWLCGWEEAQQELVNVYNSILKVFEHRAFKNN